MTTKASNLASANRRRIFFNLYSQRLTNETTKQNTDDNNEKPVYFWADEEQYVSER